MNNSTIPKPGGTPSMGRFSVELQISNHEDVVASRHRSLPKEKIRRAVVKGVVDSGATRLVLPKAVVKQLGLPKGDPINVRFADGRRARKQTVTDAQVEIQGRTGTFSAVVEPGRTDALIGAIVLEELDLVVDCTTQKLVPRDPRGILAELD